MVLGLHLFKHFLTSVSFSFLYMIRIAHLCLFGALSLLRYLDASGLTFMDGQLKKKVEASLRFCIYVAMPSRKQFIRQFLLRTIRPYLKTIELYIHVGKCTLRNVVANGTVLHTHTMLGYFK